MNQSPHSRCWPRLFTGVGFDRRDRPRHQPESSWWARARRIYVEGLAGSKAMTTTIGA